MDINKMVEEFKELTYETKKEKVISMTKLLQDADDVFSNLYKMLILLENPNVDILEYIYEVIFNISNDIDLDVKEDSISKLNDIYDKMKIINKKELEEKAQEWNPDAMLNNI